MVCFRYIAVNTLRKGDNKDDDDDDDDDDKDVMGIHICKRIKNRMKTARLHRQYNRAQVTISLL